MKKCWRFKTEYLPVRQAGLIFIILIFGLVLRVYGLNWDADQHLHPDERFLTMVTGAVSLKDFNPYHFGYNFFVYGTLPMTLTKIFSGLIKFDQYDYNNITLVGRLLSGLFDLGTVYVVFLIAKKIFNKKVGLLASFFYAISVLPIQLSHFYAVDTFLNFFLVLSFYFLISSQYLPLGISFGLAIACKISALYFLPIIGLGLLYQFYKTRNYKVFLCSMFYVLCSIMVARAVDPHIFTQQFFSNLKELNSSGGLNTWFPPAIQWLSIKPLIFPFNNLILWGLGLPLGILAIFGIFQKPKSFYPSLILFWIIGLFFYQGVQFVKALRYFFPIYPFLAILAANYLLKVKNRLILYSVFCILLIYPLSFISIYSRPHSRIQASQWIYQNIPAGSVLSCDYWDDCLPLTLSNLNSSRYQIETIAPYDQDTPEKWQKLNAQLAKIDYLILSSNRVWGSIIKVPDRYPKMSQFYQDLFAGKLNFVKVAEITSYPLFNDDSADESFTIYDHPKVLIFKNKK